MELVKLANVLIYNSENKILMAHHNSKKDYTLPGGKVEVGESFTSAAKRELFEETGIKLDFLDILIHKGEYEKNGVLYENETFFAYTDKKPFNKVLNEHSFLGFVNYDTLQRIPLAFYVQDPIFEFYNIKKVSNY